MVTAVGKRRSLFFQFVEYFLSSMQDSYTIEANSLVFSKIQDFQTIFYGEMILCTVTPV